MLIPCLIIILLLVAKKLLFCFACRFFLWCKAERALSRISCRNDLLRLKESELLHVVELIFIKNGHRVKYTDRYGESRRRMIVNGILLVEIWKQPPESLMEAETAMKLEKCMRTACLHRGMLITLGDFKACARLFCHKNVIECVGGDRLLAMCREVQAR